MWLSIGFSHSRFKASKTLSGIETRLAYAIGEGITASKPLKPFQGLKPDSFGVAIAQGAIGFKASKTLSGIETEDLIIENLGYALQSL